MPRPRMGSGDVALPKKEGATCNDRGVGQIELSKRLPGFVCLVLT
jgi:hypothetical protein